MSKQLPTDREKALAVIANGWGREATAAHPDCTCGQPRPVTGDVPPCQRCGAGVNEKCRQPGAGLCGADPHARARRRRREAQALTGCPMHDVVKLGPAIPATVEYVDSLNDAHDAFWSSVTGTIPDSSPEP